MRVPKFFNRKFLFYLLLGIASLQLISVVLFFMFRDGILQNKLDEKIQSFNNKYPARLVVSGAHFTGLAGIEIDGISLIPDDGDTLLNLAQFQADMRIVPLLFGQVKIKNLEVRDFYAHIIKKSGCNNFSFLLKKEKKDTVKEEKGYAAVIERLSDKFFDFVPGNAVFENMNLKVSLDSAELMAHVDEVIIADDRFVCHLELTENSRSSTWNFRGDISKGSRTAGLTISPENPMDTVPYLKDLLGLKMKFDSLSFGLKSNMQVGGVQHLNGYFSAYGLLLHHKKISAANVLMSKAIFDFDLNVGKDFIELDSSSSVIYDKLALNPYVLFQSGDSKKYTFKIHDEFKAQDLFGSLPAGLFTNFENIQTSGDLCLGIDFYYDSKFPDSLEFNAGLVGKNFKLLTYGETDFSKIAGTFMHTVYDNGVPVASFLVGDDNPDFTSIDDISLLLKEAVIIAENGGTYYQQGYDVNSLRLAIIQDIKEGKFVRGGSTIEMQLVKNVFLTKSKTIARKLEELLIVWMIQSGNLCSHDRMFEVYLNIAEWGPGIYGISQAAKFYFNKTAAQLTVPESIFLASILPRPKWFMYSFDKAGNLNPETNSGYFSTIATLLVERGTISPADTFNLLDKVKLRAESKLLMMKDSSYFDVNEMQRQDADFMKKGTSVTDQKSNQTREQNKSQNKGDQRPDGNMNNDPRRKDPRNR